MNGVPSLRVPQCHAQLYRKFLETKGVLDLKYCMQKYPDGTVTLPLQSSILPQLDLPALQYAIAPDSTCEIVHIQVPQLSKKARAKSCVDKLVDALQELLASHGEKWSEELRKDIPQKWQRHGDLIMFGEDCFRQTVWKKIGPGLWQAVAHGLGVKRLAQIKCISKDGYRSPVVTLVLGESSYVTHTDNHIRYEFDVTKCMFSFGNITEKLRIASFNCSGETVVDLYAGIGYFTLPYLVHAGAAHVHACEWNPDAVAALQRNLHLNGVSDRCTVHQGDNRQLTLQDVADRVNLGLIPSSKDGWPVACQLLRKDTGGVLHIHENVTSVSCTADQKNHSVTELQRNTTLEYEQDGENLNESTMSDMDAWKAWAGETANRIAALLKDITGDQWRTNIQHIEHVKSYAPHINHIVLDLECRPLI
ncbi:tRNA wybutosine-synthesizing protein 2 homolog [Chanos chanos]|uniref:tRNA wybutosine-synthesizing protein 2 homolog n=1 Tax=Chanos chanos TaxID=29144 RepID=A0A6J2UT93_CHACN|nr:tRNA wybutosine-synthesizing protein 2 homolog [Chanos chanos]